MGSGKTTTVRQYLQRTGGFSLHQITVNGKSYPFHYNKAKKILITGVYGRRVCDGCDGLITNKEVMMSYLIKLLDTVKPDIVIFEAVMYGITSTFTLRLEDLLKERGYHYRGIALIPPVEFCLSNVMTRNGGKSINVKMFRSKWLQAKRSAENLKENGLDIDIIDTSKIRMDQMNTLIERELT
jgi:hypothetical protein